MTIASAKTADPSHEWTPGARAGNGFIRYLSMLCEVLGEALQQTQEARRKYPFADV